EEQRREVGALAEVGDRDPCHLGLQALDEQREQVVRERSGERLAPHEAGDRLRLERPHEDRQHARAVQLPQHDHVLLGLRLGAEPMDPGLHYLHGRLPPPFAVVAFFAIDAVLSGLMNSGTASVRMWSTIHCAEVVSSDFGYFWSSSLKTFSASS